MKLSRKWLTLLLALVMVASLAFGLTACKKPVEENPEEPITLAAPVVKLDGNVLTWGAVENATYYIVYEGNSSTGTNVNGTSFTIVKTVSGTYTYTVAAYNSNANPKVGPKSNSVTYTYTASVGGDDDKCECPNCGCETCTDCTNCGCPDCGGAPIKDKLNAPLVAIEGNALNWRPDSNAVAYDVYKNGEKIDTVESFSFLGEETLPSTYTIANANDGDTFQVVAVSGNDAYDDSELSEEVSFEALDGTLSIGTPVYATNETTELAISASIAGKLYLVKIHANNNLAITAGHHGTASITVKGDFANSDSAYTAEAELVDGIWTAKIVISGSNKLYLDIDGMFDGITLGYTVSLADPYATEDGADANVVKSYTLGATGSVDVVIPYNIGGYRIKINLGDDVPLSGNVLYVVLEDGTTNSNVYLQAGTVTSPLNAMDGYYVSNTFSYGSGAIYLNSSSVDLKATISIEAPDIVYASAPSITVDSAAYNVEIGKGENSATVFKVDGVEAGDYILVINTAAGLASVNAKLDDGSYSKLTAVSNVYSMPVTIEDNSLLFVYASESTLAKSVSLYPAEGNFYTLSAEAPVEDALLGYDLDTATQFRLNRITDGDYVLTITGTAYGLTFNVIVGEETYTISTCVNNYPYYVYSTEIAISGQESISIYVTNGTYIADVSIEEVVVVPLPELTHGISNGVKFTIENGTTYTFALKDVPAGTYKLALSGFDTYEDYCSLRVKVGENTVVLCNTSQGYLGELDIVIGEEDTELNVSMSNGYQKVTFTIYLLDEGETLVGGGDGDTSLNITVEIEYSMFAVINISSLVAGTYNVNLSIDDWKLSGNANFELFFEIGGDTVTLSGNPFVTGTLVIPEGGKSQLCIRLNGSSSSTKAKVTIELELVGGNGGDDEDLEGGGSETELTFEFDENDNPIKSYMTTLDVSTLKYGVYTVTFTNLPSTWVMYYLNNGTDDDVEFTSANNWTATITIKSGTITLMTSAQWDPVTITFVRVESGEGGGNESQPGTSYENPIVCETFIDTFSAEDMQEAWFQIPATGFGYFGVTFTIQFAAGLTVEIDGGYYKTPLTSGGMLELDWMNTTIIHVVSTDGTPISFTISEGSESGEDGEGTLGTSQSVTIDIPDDTFVTVTLGGTVSDGKSYVIKITGEIPADVKIWIFGNEYAASQTGEEGDYAIAILINDYDFSAQVEGLYNIICIKASSALTNVTITLEEV